MEFDSRSPSYARQDGHVEQYSFRRAVAFFKNFGSNNASAHSPGLSRVTTPILCPSLAALNELSLIERHPLVGRAQDIGYDASETPHHEESPTSHAYITDLCNVLRTFGEEWIRRLASCTNVPQVLPEQYFCSLLKLGIRSLRNHFRGASPRSFQDIFALIHVAMASSYIVCEDDHDYPGNAFLEEAYQWQNLLSDEIEKGAFSKVMSQLCHSQELAASSSFKEVTVDNSFLPAEQAMLVRLIDHLSSNRVDMGIKENSDVDRENSAVENEQSRSPRLLQSNAIIKGCMGFLDGKAYVYVILGLNSLVTIGRFRPCRHC